MRHSAVSGSGVAAICVGLRSKQHCSKQQRRFCEAISERACARKKQEQQSRQENKQANCKGDTRK